MASAEQIAADEQAERDHDILRDQRDEAAYELTFAKNPQEFATLSAVFIAMNEAWQASLIAAVRAGMRRNGRDPGDPA